MNKSIRNQGIKYERMTSQTKQTDVKRIRTTTWKNGMKADNLKDFIGIQRNVGGVEVDHKNGVNSEFSFASAGVYYD
jgi:hypothetical protein